MPGDNSAGGSAPAAGSWPGQIRPAEAADADDVAALATRRAAPFYRALGYQESAVYFRKVLR